MQYPACSSRLLAVGPRVPSTLVNDEQTLYDSAHAWTVASRRSTARLEADVRDRDEQLRALRLELKQLKAINDLQFTFSHAQVPNGQMQRLRDLEGMIRENG